MHIVNCNLAVGKVEDCQIGDLVDRHEISCGQLLGGTPEACHPIQLGRCNACQVIGKWQLWLLDL